MVLIFSLIAAALASVTIYVSNIYNTTDIQHILLVSVSIALIITATVFFVLFLKRNTARKIKELSTRLDMWNSISYHVDQAGDEVFNVLPVGIMIYKSDDEVTWANQMAKNIFGYEVIEKKLNELNDDLSKYVDNKENNFTIKVGENYYEVVNKTIEESLYLFDVTARELLGLKYKNRTSAIGIMSIDNLEKSLKNYDMQAKAEIRGQILGAIVKWVGSYNGYLQFNADDRITMITDLENLHKMIEDEFSILDIVKTAPQNPAVKASLSIGIACYDRNANNLGQIAETAYDVSVKRGGDQVAVNIENEAMRYFGGNSSAEKDNSLVTARNQTTELKEIIEKSSNVFIMTHYNADCDAIGGMIGVSKLVEASGKIPNIIISREACDVTVKEIYDKIKADDTNLFSKFIEGDNVENINKNSVLIMCDTQGPNLAMFPNILKRFDKVCVIDHHRVDEISYERKNYEYLDTVVSSTVELVAEMFAFIGINTSSNTLEKEKELSTYVDINLTPFEATVMLAGIVVDTNNFTYRTGVRTFDACSILKGYGADMVLVRRLIRESSKETNQINRAVASAEIFLDRFAIAILDDDNIAKDRTLLARVSDSLLEANHIDAAFTIGKMENEVGKIGVSARSYTDINVQVIMEEMDGGGHINSAATQLENMTTTEVYNKLCDILRREYADEGDADMKIILLKDVKGKGKAEEIIDVATGYGNHLVTSGQAVLASEETINDLKNKKEQRILDEKNHHDLMERLKKDIDGKSVNIGIKVGDEGKAFGSVTTKQIVEEFEKQNEIVLDKRKVSVQGEINGVGIYNAKVTLDKDVVANITVNVSRK